MKGGWAGQIKVLADGNKTAELSNTIWPDEEEFILPFFLCQKLSNLRKIFL